jgi:rubrerythrin
MAILRRSKRTSPLVRCVRCGYERQLSPPRCPNCGERKTVPLHL